MLFCVGKISTLPKNNQLHDYWCESVYIYNMTMLTEFTVTHIEGKCPNTQELQFFNLWGQVPSYFPLLSQSLDKLQKSIYQAYAIFTSKCSLDRYSWVLFYTKGCQWLVTLEHLWRIKLPVPLTIYLATYFFIKSVQGKIPNSQKKTSVTLGLRVRVSWG